jgi:hypothetical protein
MLDGVLADFFLSFESASDSLLNCLALSSLCTERSTLDVFMSVFFRFSTPAAKDSNRLVITMCRSEFGTIGSKPFG